MVRAVLVGCGAMSEAWLGPARETGVEMVGLVDIDRGPRPAARPPVRSRRRRHRHRPRRDARADEARRRLRRRGPVGAPRDRSHRAPPRLPRPDREAARREPGGCPRDRRSRARRRPHPRGDPEPPLPRRAAAHPPLPRLRRHRRADEHPLRLLRSPALRRVPRGDATTCSSSTWRSTPSIPPASSSTARPSASSAASGTRRAPGTARAPPPPPSST